MAGFGATGGRSSTTSPIRSSPEPTTGYRPALDGLRAVAVALVVAFHLGHLPGGILGVDVFFVVSGWLITWRLLAEIEHGATVRLRRFWASRIRRLMPASLLLLVVVAVVWSLADITVSSLRRDLLWSLAWAANWGTISGGGDYWARFGNPSPLSHFWSLAIEEQFYVVWPVALWTVARWSRHSRATVGTVAAVGSIASIAFMIAWFDPLSPTSTYMNTAARAHTLLIGAAAAAITRPRPDGSLRGGPVARRLAPVAVGFAAMIVVRASDHSDWLFRWGFPAFALAMAVVVVAAAAGAGVRVLASPPLRWLGDRSYGLYLWHWPAILLLSPERTHLDGVVLDAAQVLVSVVLADLSLRFVEAPIRSRRRLRGWRAPVAMTAAFSVVTALAVMLVPGPVGGSSATVVTLPPITPPPATSAPATGPTDSEKSAPTTSAGAVPGSTTATTLQPGPVRVLVAGDSTAVHLAGALLSYATAHPQEIVAGSAAFPGCGLSAGDDGRLHVFTNDQGQPEQLSIASCLDEWRSIPERVASPEQIDVVLVYIGAWDAVDILLRDGRTVSVADPIGRAMIETAYRAFVDAVESAGASVAWVTPPDADLQWGAVDSPLDDPARWQALREIIDSLPVEQIDLPGWLTGHGLTGPTGRPDGVHLTADGNVQFVAELVAPTLVQIRAMHTG